MTPTGAGRPAPVRSAQPCPMGHGVSARTAGAAAIPRGQLQHPERYCVSAKSLAARPVGLRLALERGGHPSDLTAVQRWLNGPPAIEKPALPSSRGGLTIGDVHGATDADAHAAAVERWARSTWKAYAAVRPLARRWIEGHGPADERPRGGISRS